MSDCGTSTTSWWCYFRYPSDGLKNHRDYLILCSALDYNWLGWRNRAWCLWLKIGTLYFIILPPVQIFGYAPESAVMKMGFILNTVNKVHGSRIRQTCRKSCSVSRKIEMPDKYHQISFLSLRANRVHSSGQSGHATKYLYWSKYQNTMSYKQIFIMHLHPELQQGCNWEKNTNKNVPSGMCRCLPEKIISLLLLLWTNKLIKYANKWPAKLIFEPPIFLPSKKWLMLWLI